MSFETSFKIEEISERNICILRANGALNTDARKDFVTKTQELLESQMEKLVIDFTHVTQIFSLYFGTVVDVAKKASDKEKNFSILAKEKLGNLMKQAKIDEMVHIVIVD